jgi:hypothetical protein
MQSVIMLSVAYEECHDLAHKAECHKSLRIKLNVVMLSVVMLSVIMLNVVMLNVVMPSVVAPFCRVKKTVSSVAKVQPHPVAEKNS